MILTRIKKKQSTIKNGVYTGSIFSIGESKGLIKIVFNVSGSQITLELPISAESHSRLCKIAYLGGIKEKEDINLSSFVNLKLKLFVSGGKITKIQSV